MDEDRIVQSIDRLLNLRSLNKCNLIDDKEVGVEKIILINKFLVSINFPVVDILMDGRYKIPKVLIDNWELKKQQLYLEIKNDKDSRKYSIILATFIKKEWLSNFHLQELLNLSKNSVLTELNYVKKTSNKFQVSFKYSRKKGYILVGNEYDIRKLVEFSLAKLSVSKNFVSKIETVFNVWGYSPNIESTAGFIQYLFNQEGAMFVQERIQELIYLSELLRYRLEKQPFTFKENQELILTDYRINIMAQKLAIFLGIEKNFDDEVIFLGTRILAAMQGEFQGHISVDFEKISKEIIENVERLTFSDFNNKRELQKTLYLHLVPSYFRILFDIQLENPMVDEIKQQYKNLFYIVKKALTPLEETLGKEISSEEIAYFTIHFGGHLELSRYLGIRVRALAVCPNGISSSLIMTSQLKELFPKFIFQNIHSVEDAKKLDSSTYDIVFSNVFFPTEKKVYLVRPILNPLEKEFLVKQVNSDFDLPMRPSTPTIEELIRVIRKHANIFDERGLYQEFSNVFDSEKQDLKDRSGKNLNELLELQNIQFVEKVDNWQDAITIAAQPLLKHGNISKNYVKAMIETVEEMGAYIVLAPKVAVPHARPEAGVHRLGISLLHLVEPVDFNFEGEDDPDRLVKLIFVLAAIDSSSHLTALSQLSSILEDEDEIDQLIEAKNANELYQIIDKHIKLDKGE